MTTYFSTKSQLKASENLQFRERDRLLQLIITTFKSVGEVRAYDITQRQEQIKQDTATASYLGDDARKVSTSGRRQVAEKLPNKLQT